MHIISAQFCFCLQTMISAPFLAAVKSNVLIPLQSRIYVDSAVIFDSYTRLNGLNGRKLQTYKNEAPYETVCSQALTFECGVVHCHHWYELSLTVRKATSISSTVNTNIETHQLDPNAREHNLAS